MSSLKLFSLKPRFSRIDLSTWQQYWLEVYDAIRGVMGYSLSGDVWASRVLRTLAIGKSIEGGLVGLEEFCSMLASRMVCVAGGSRCLEDHISDLWLCDTLVAVDGAVSLLLKNGIVPDIVFTDLDGSWHYLLEASRKGSLMVVHGHGDNTHALKSLVPGFNRIIATVQASPHPPYTYVLGGFTDGDRAVHTILLCGVDGIVLYGMRFNEPTGWWSKPWLRSATDPWPEKKRKLVLGKQLLDVAKRFASMQGIELVEGC